MKTTFHKIKKQPAYTLKRLKDASFRANAENSFQKINFA